MDNKYLKEKQEINTNIKNQINLNIDNTKFRLEMEEIYLKLKRSLNGIINAYNVLEDENVKGITLNIIKDIELELLTKGIKLELEKEYEEKKDKRIPRITSVSFSYFNNNPLIANKYDYENIIDDDEKAEREQEGFMGPNRKLQLYSYDGEKDIRDIHGYLMVPDKYYDQFITSLSNDLYINSRDLSRRDQNAMKEAVEKETNFVGQIIYADEDILRIRSKARYTNNYSGIEDYIYTRGSDPNFEKFMLNHLLFDSILDIPKSLLYLRPRANYLNKIYLSYKKEYMTPHLIWSK